LNIDKAVITAAGPDQRELPLQTLVDRDGRRKSILRLLLREALDAGVSEVAVVIAPGDADAFSRAAGDLAGRLHLLEQHAQGGYAGALLCARDFAGADAFLHLVGDHVWQSRAEENCARQLVDVAAKEACCVSAVQPTRESQLPFFGAVGGAPVPGREGQYTVERVAEKPTPTFAEEQLHVPGLRAGRYLCFFGMHVLTSGIWPCLESEGSLSDALGALCVRERTLAFVPDGTRHDVGSRYGLLMAQVALALAGEDREEVLFEFLEMLAQRAPTRT